MRWLPAAIVAFACLVLFVYWAWPDRGAPEAADRPVEPATVRSRGDEVGIQGESVAPRIRPGSTDERRPIDGPALEGRILDAEGQPIGGAEITWTALQVEDRDFEPSWHDDDWGPLERSTRATISGPDGGFLFSVPPEETGQGSILWASHPRHLADVRRFQPGEVAKLDGSWVLQEAAPIRVRVLDAGGAPLSDAQVDQFGLVPEATPRADERVRARRLLHRSVSTDPTGEAELGLFPGDQVLAATAGGLCSAPRRIRSGATIVLRLAPTFTVEGTAAFDSWEQLDYVGERRITVHAQRGNLLQSLVSLRRVEAGSFGPLVVPLLPDVDRYTVRLEGSPIVPDERSFPVPAAGSRESFDLVGRLGHSVWFAAENPEGVWLHDAEARVWWRDREFPFEWHVVERRARPEDGLIAVWSLPPGGIRYEVHAPGYTPYVNDDLELPCAPEAHLVTLQRAARIRGRCLHDGEPVSDFEVAVWPADYEPFRRLYAFTDREDGSFEIDEAPAGAMRITASTARLPFAEPLRLDLVAGESREVVLELAPALVGAGRVVDAESGEPLPGALLQLYLSTNRTLAPWGLPHPVDAEGYFEIAGFVAGSNRVTVSAPGYATLETAVQCAADGALQDLGTIALHRPQPLEFRLLGEPGTPFSDFQLLINGPQPLPLTAFPRDGVLHLAQAAPGYHFFVLHHPDGTQTGFSIEFAPGRNWVVERPVEGPHEIEVVPVADDERELERVSKVSIAFQSRQGYWVQVFSPTVQTGQPIRFLGVDGDSVQVRLLDAAQQELGTANARLASQERTVVPVPLGIAPFRVRVVDGEGQPIPDVTVTVFDVADPATSVQGATGETGECELRGVPEGPIELSLRHPSRGHRHRIAADGSVREQEFRLDGDARIELQLLDGVLPIEGVECVFLASHGIATADPVSSGPAGRVTLSNLSPDRYRVRCTHPTCWSVEGEYDARVETEVVPVQIRRVGGLTLLFTTASGVPVSGVALELHSTEFDAEVANWISEGRARGEAEMRTDLRGELRVEGLPHGPYSWRARLDGTELTGEAIVMPGQDTRLLVALP